jgi:hypothetical protein
MPGCVVQIQTKRWLGNKPIPQLWHVAIVDKATAVEVVKLLTEALESETVEALPVELSDEKLKQDGLNPGDVQSQIPEIPR